uniref:Mediator of RNA polymerase II transcription subunit 7 n=1 Tax=Setaria viridis TaxID=4556 RepID=A0A4U6V4Q1_SETVI|nr:hypothetical protein SEVIR_3G026800v2 [Setaria viridis]
MLCLPSDWKYTVSTDLTDQNRHQVPVDFHPVPHSVRRGVTGVRRRPDAAVRCMVAMATSAYPPPPPFYRLYKDYEQDPSSAPEPPPPPPIDQIYTTFGADRKTNELLPSLESHNLRQLYPNSPNIDFKKELRTLNRELQLHILEVADILVERPSQYARRVEDISLIFSNLHHLLNSLRPHQARATLIHMLESQIQRRKQAIEDIKQRREEAQKLLGESLLILDGSQTN